MRSCTAFPGIGRDPAARSRMRSPRSLMIGYQVLRASCFERARNDHPLDGGSEATSRNTKYEARSTPSCPQPQHLLVRPEGGEDEGDVVVQGGAKLGDSLLDILAAHPLREPLVLELLLHRAHLEVGEALRRAHQ